MNIKRTLFGALISLVIAGEVMASSANGLFSPLGFLVLFGMYFVYFLVIDSYRDRFSPSFLQMILFNFALYAVLITGFLHGEFLTFLKPDEVLITTIIRIQASLFIIFIFPIVDAIVPADRKMINMKTALILFCIFFVLLSPSGKIGFITLFNTVKAAPAVSIVFTFAAGAALYFSLRKNKSSVVYPSKKWLILISVLSLVPFIPLFILYSLFMTLITLLTLKRNRTYT